MTPEEIEAMKQSNLKLEAKNAELLAEKQRIAAEKKKLEDDKAIADAKAAKDAGDYKTLAEKLENDNKLLKEQGEAKDKSRIAEIKKGAFSLELDKLGIIPERKAFILGSVNLDALQYIEAGNVVLGVDAKAKEIQTQMPEIFGKPGNNLPGQGAGNGGQGGGGAAPAHMTDEWWKTLSIADQDKHRAEYFKSKGIPYKPR